MRLEGFVQKPHRIVGVTVAPLGLEVLLDHHVAVFGMAVREQADEFVPHRGRTFGVEDRSGFASAQENKREKGG
jgi:hypothetical protein